MCEHLRRLGQRRDGTTSGAGPINPTLVLQNITTVIMGKRASSRRFKAFVTVFSQNCLGLKTGERFTEMIDVLTQRKAFAVGVQETWRSGVERFDQQGWRYLGVGPEQQHGRGTMGVGIFLSPAAVRAHDAAGGEFWPEGLRVASTRLLASVGGYRAPPRGVFLLDTYAPTSAHSDQEWDDYYASVDAALARMHPGDLLVWLTDGNASLGIAPHGAPRGAAVGAHGLAYVNASGRRLRTFLELRELYALTTHYPKKVYGTW